MNRANTIRAAILTLWITAMILVLRYEAYPEWFTHTIPGYKGILSDSLLARESWSRILINGTPAGYSHTSLGVDDETKDLLLDINNRVHLKIKLLGQTRRILSQTAIQLDRDYKLVSFDTSVSTTDFSMRAVGKLIEKRQFNITITTGDTLLTHTLDIPGETFLYSPVQELAMRNLRPGSRLSLKTINPLTLQPSILLIKAIGRETIPHGGKPVNVTHLVTTWQGMELQSWINEEGIVLRQETPLGWIIESCTASEALETVSSENEPPALFPSTGGVAGVTFLNLLLGK